ncbi:MAG: acetate kinase, partial [Myxococcales bacterium]|nr:acetate kinase [Myxococcales bacterium]
LQIPLESAKIITCHLGNGASLAAIADGRSVDTSMGFTPLEGLVMGTRCGDLDPAIPLFLQKHLLMNADQVDVLLNRRSGLLGLSGLSNDMRELLSARAEGHEGAKRALDVFVYRLRKYIGAYSASLGGLDVLVFTGGIGEHASEIRDEVTREMQWMGLVVDGEKNRRAGDVVAQISADTSRVHVMVVPTDEELAIARDTYSLVRGDLPNKVVLEP